MMQWVRDQEISKMVNLVGPQNLKMVALLEPKFSQKCFLSKFLRVSAAPRPILSLRSQLYIIFVYT